MLHLARKVRGAVIHGIDGELGRLEDLYFEEHHWAVRYLLVETGSWMHGKRVLVSPLSVDGEWSVTGIPVRLSRDHVRNSPTFNPQEPISAEIEEKLLGYYGYPDYWSNGGVWGGYDNPGALLAAPMPDATRNRTRTALASESRELRSINNSTGYHLHAKDGDIGHVDDFLIGQESWRIRYLLVDTSNWIGGRSVLVSCAALETVDPDHKKLHLAVTRDVVENSPAFDSIEAALDTRETGPPFSFI